MFFFFNPSNIQKCPINQGLEHPEFRAMLCFNNEQYVIIISVGSATLFRSNTNLTFTFMFTMPFF